MALPAQPAAASAWRATTADLRRLVSESAYDIWLAPIRPQSWDGEALVISAPEATQSWLAGRFGPLR